MDGIEHKLAINQLSSLQAHINNLLNDEMQLLLQPLSNPIREIVNYYYSLGGKKFRPALFLAVAQAFNSDENLAPHALALELIHTMSLYHDDVIDEAIERRGAQTAHKKWNKATAIVGGDILHGLIHGHIVDAILQGRIKKEKTTLLFLKDLIYSVEIPIGSTVILEMNLSKQSELPSIDEATEITAGKTAPLFAFSTAAGALIAEQPANIVEDMYEMGRQAGYAYQLLDDIADYFKSDKDMGGDLREDKKTPILILANKYNPDKVMKYRDKRNILIKEDIIGFRKDFAQVLHEVLGWSKNSMSIAQKYLMKIPDNTGKEYIKALFSLLSLKIKEYEKKINSLIDYSS